MRSLLYILFIQAALLITLPGNLFGQEVVQKVNAAMKAGDAAKLSEYFNSSLDISLPDTDQTMSKAQATQVMKGFFKENIPIKYKVNHEGSSREATKYIIGTYTTASKSFKTYILLKETDGKYLIVQLQIEED